jgi:hypothetical protein
VSAPERPRNGPETAAFNISAAADYQKFDELPSQYTEKHTNGQPANKSIDSFPP